MTKITFSIGAYIAFVCVLATLSRADNWPSFRGPLGSGLGEGTPPTRWNVETGESILWKVPVEGLALASPIIWGDKLFLTTAVGQDTNPKFEPDPSFGYDIQREKDVWQWKVICLDKSMGKRLWERIAHEGAPKNGRHSESTHANATPTTDGMNLVAMFGSEGLYCYAMDGALKWKTDLGQLNAAPDGHPHLEWGYSSSPIIHNEKVIVQCDVQGGCFVSVMDLKNGKELKRIPRDDVPAFATPNAHTVFSRDQVICNGYKEAAAYDLESGRKIWWFHSRGDVPVPRPIFAHGLIYITAAHGGRNLLAIHPDAVGNLTPGNASAPNPVGIAWFNERQGSYIPTPIVYERILYIPNERGVMAAFDAITGAAIYEERIVAGRGGSYYASPVAAGGKIYVTANNGDVHVFRAGRRFEKLATNKMDEPTMATPAISGARLFVRTRSQLYCIGEPKE
ncbi:PQQ-like beta-propeller repeat protein [bacterium]|jgi:outer membrane protein assembly factor BamB|nr:PQQ-like beta-propeller repeat protein [Verrucomicrobiota bacterium]MDA7645412.1 PQQ-like beta-propeller repeat protein [bacterium]